MDMNSPTLGLFLCFNVFNFSITSAFVRLNLPEIDAKIPP